MGHEAVCWRSRSAGLIALSQKDFAGGLHAVLYAPGYRKDPKSERLGLIDYVGMQVHIANIRNLHAPEQHVRCV